MKVIEEEGDAGILNPLELPLSHAENKGNASKETVSIPQNLINKGGPGATRNAAYLVRIQDLFREPRLLEGESF